MNWQPIATAPKQGFCLGYDPHLKRPFPIMWNERKGKFVALDAFGDETPTLWQPLPAVEEWFPISTAPKDSFILGFDPDLKRPFVTLWNVPGEVFSSFAGQGNEVAQFWLPLPDMPTAAEQAQR